MNWISHSVSETEAIGREVAGKLHSGDVVACFGDLGAGKTAFTRGLAAGLGCTGRVTSPTFTIVNEYEGTIPLFHFDMYRLSGEDDLFDIGWEDYLSRGGKVVYLSDPPQDGALTNLESIMAYYGISAAEGIVVEGDQNRYIWGMPYYLLPELNSHTITYPLMEENYSVLLPLAQGLIMEETENENISTSELLTTSDSAFSKAAGYQMTTYEKEDGDIDGPFALAVAASETLDDGIYSDVVWISSTSLLDEQTNEMVAGGNQDFFLNVLNFLCDAEESSISIHAKSLSTEYLTMQSSTVTLLTVLLVAIIPAAYLAIGIIIWFRRKRR